MFDLVTPRSEKTVQSLNSDPWVPLWVPYRNNCSIRLKPFSVKCLNVYPVNYCNYCNHVLIFLKM